MCLQAETNASRLLNSRISLLSQCNYLSVSGPHCRNHFLHLTMDRSTEEIKTDWEYRGGLCVFFSKSFLLILFHKLWSDGGGGVIRIQWYGDFWHGILCWKWEPCAELWGRGCGGKRQGYSHKKCWIVTHLPWPHATRHKASWQGRPTPAEMIECCGGSIRMFLLHIYWGKACWMYNIVFSSSTPMVLLFLWLFSNTVAAG